MQCIGICKSNRVLFVAWVSGETQRSTMDPSFDLFRRLVRFAVLYQAVWILDVAWHAIAGEDCARRVNDTSAGRVVAFCANGSIQMRAGLKG